MMTRGNDQSSEWCQLRLNCRYRNKCLISKSSVRFWMNILNLHTWSGLPVYSPLSDTWRLASEVITCTSTELVRPPWALRATPNCGGARQGDKEGRGHQLTDHTLILQTK